jgi:hypothetical protein
LGNKYFFFGKVLRGSQDNVTVGKDFVVEGGAGKEHKDTVEIVRLFGEGVKMDGPHHAEEILKDAIKKVKG